MKNYQKFVIVTLVFLILILLSFSWKYFTSALARAKVAFEGRAINDTTLTAQLVVGGLKAPSAMAFLGPDDILITEKNTGNIMRAVNGVISPQKRMKEVSWDLPSQTPRTVKNTFSYTIRKPCLMSRESRVQTP